MPPSEIGVAGTATTATAASSPDGEQGRDIRGIAASRGVVTGPAKVMSELAQGDKLLPGDILVCKTTSPPWTVLFGRAAAVVAETGGALAHTAITAREYAIPCVVGARGATDRIHDGMLIKVNGTEGVVSLPAQRRRPAQGSAEAPRRSVPRSALGGPVGGRSTP